MRICLRARARRYAYFALLAVNSTRLPKVRSSGRRPNAIWSPNKTVYYGDMTWTK